MLQTRRNFIAATGAAVLAPLIGGKARALGSKTIRTFSDGHLTLPRSLVLPDIPDAAADAFLTEHGQPTDRFEPECNLTLLENGERTVLFDAGAGPNFVPSAGRLAETLSNAGLDPASITDVVFTHAHPDHLWGILDDFDEITFPDARLHMARAEWDFWRADDVLAKVGEARQGFAVGAQNRMVLMEDRVELFDPGAEVIPDVEAVDTAGHTPGHVSFAIHSGSDYLMVIGDALTNHVVSFLKPDWPSGSDQDAERGVATRLSLLDRLVSDKAAITGFHLPNGGQGRVERDGKVFRFVQDG